MRNCKTIFFLFFFALFAASSVTAQKADMADSIHDMIRGSWVDSISNTEFRYLNIDELTVSDYTFYSTGPNKNIGNEVTPTGFYYSYFIDKKKCIPDSLKTPINGGTGYSLVLTWFHSNDSKGCFYILSINPSEMHVLFYANKPEGEVFKRNTSYKEPGHDGH